MARDPHIDKLIQDLKTKKFREGEAKGLTETYGEEISKQLKPLFSEHSKEIMASIKEAFKNLKIDVPKQDSPVVNVPEFPQFPEFPKQERPIVNVPAPVVNVPAPIVNVAPTAVNFPERMRLQPNDKPFPVIMVDQVGKPMNFGSGATSVGGGRGDFFTIKDIQNSTGGSIVDNDGNVKISGTVTALVSAANNSTQSIDSSGNVYSQANPFPVVQVSAVNNSTQILDASNAIVGSASNPFNVAVVSQSNSSSQLVDSSNNVYSQTNPLPIVNVGGAAGTSVSLVDSDGVYYNGANLFSVRVSEVFGSTSTNVINPDGRIKVELPTGSSGLTDTELRASHIDVVQMSGSVDSVVVNSGTITTVSTVTAVTGITNSVAVVNLDRDGNPVSEWPVGPSLAGVNETNADVLRAVLMSDTTNSVNVVTFNGNAPATGLNETNVGVLRAVLMSDTSNSVNIMAQGITIDTRQVSGSADSVFVVGPIAQGDEATAIRTVHAGNSATSVASQATGLNETTAGVLRAVLMTDSLNSVNNVQWGGSAVATGLNENTAGVIKVAMITSVVESVNVVTFNGNAPATGLNETTSGVLRSVLMTDSVVSVFMTGAADSSFIYEARTTNPTAKSDGADVRPKADKLGRTLVRPVQVRDLTLTAYVTTTTGIETTLRAAVAGAFLDCIMLTATNGSTAAVTVDIRSTTAGSIVHTMVLPASTGPVGWSPSVPWPQDNQGNNWTVDVQGSDVSNTSVYFSALFSQEI